MSKNPKNIILCADGTGNRGGETPDTNVYRIHHSVDLHRPERGRDQITFYDNGIGTQTNKYIRAVSGALGFGFGKNIQDLYEFLARNYNEGDLVYLFGFSRGAATVRAFAGMLQECGLVDRNCEACKSNGKFDYDKFVKLIEKAFAYYRSPGYDLRLREVDAIDKLEDTGRSLVIIALVDKKLHIRIFDSSRSMVVDKSESELSAGKSLTALKRRVEELIRSPDASSLSQQDKQAVIDEATSIAGHADCRTDRKFKQSGVDTKEVRIKFMGIWDTVSALGFPYQRVGDSLWEDLLERPLAVWPARWGDRLLNFGRLAHTFYNYTPNEIVDHVYHAIAIDDERKSFLPRVWDETGSKTGNVTQVWFSGMHSDVGGGYNQTKLAYEALVWMMERAEHHGLGFVEGAPQEAKDKANVQGMLHNSRDGLAIYYRYAPRDIEDLSKNRESAGNKIKGKIKIHKSVIDRMERATDRYAPGLLPTKFEIVDTPIENKNENKLVDYGVGSENPVDPHVVDASPIVIDAGAGTAGTANGWMEDRKGVAAVVKYRRILYRVFADFSFSIVVVAVLLWATSDEGKYDSLIPRGDNDELFGVNIGLFNCGLNHLGDILRYFSPKIFDPFIQEAVVDRPYIFVVLIAVFWALRIIRAKKNADTVGLSVQVREKILAAYRPPSTPRA